MIQPVRFRRAYSISFKLEAVDYAKQHTKEAAARHFGVDSKRIREWCKQEQQLSELANDSNTSQRQRLERKERKQSPHECAKEDSVETVNESNIMDSVDMQEQSIDRQVMRKAYNITFKLNAVEFAKKNNKDSAARKFGVDSKRIRDWCKQEEELRRLADDATTSKRLRLEKKSRKKKYKEQQVDHTEGDSEVLDLRIHKKHRRKRSYSISFKLEAVEYAKTSTKGATARKFNVDAKRIRDWCKQESALKHLAEGTSSRKRLEGGGRKRFSDNMEQDVLNWMDDLLSQNIHPSRRMIKEYARRKYEGSATDSGAKFVASNGWLCNFLNRYGLTQERKTNKGSQGEIRENAEERIVTNETVKDEALECLVDSDSDLEEDLD